MKIEELFKNPLDKAQRFSSFFTDVIGYKDEARCKPAHCQRPLCWTAEQEHAFVVNAIESADYGQFIIIRDLKTNYDYIIDGQHRINALTKFLNGNLILEQNGQSVDFTKLNREDRFFIKQRLVGSVRMFTVPDYAEVKPLAEELYFKFNFSGVRH